MVILKDQRSGLVRNCFQILLPQYLRSAGHIGFFGLFVSATNLNVGNDFLTTDELQ